MAKQFISKKKRVCQAEGCNRKTYAKGYCLRHYKQISKHGKIYGNPKKLKYGELNRYIFEGGICKIELYDREGNVKDYAIIDAEDYEKIKGIKWSMGGRGYVGSNRRNGSFFKLHRIILGLSLGDKNPDHIDGNPLNNCKSNLRICTQQQNTCNSKISKNNTSGYKGVYWDKSRKAWAVHIKFNYKSIYLGRFKKKITAARVYNEAAIKFFGEFAKLNCI